VTINKSFLFEPTSILVTGGCGFIGSNFIKYVLKSNKGLKVINVDSLTYAGNLENLSEVHSNPNYIFVKADIRDNEVLMDIFNKYSPDSILNFAAESHVDRSIFNPNIFFETNVGGTLNLLNISLKNNVSRFLQVSTDEVYGSLGENGFFTEDTTLSPNSPYSASKASADMFVRAYNKTFGLSTIITRCSNNYGPYQFPEKLIPLVINNAIHNKKIPVYGDGKNVRDWIHVNCHCKGIWAALTRGNPGEVYNFGGNNEFTNIQIVKKILKILDKPTNLIEFVKDRPGHDQRYAIDASKSKSDFDWSPDFNFETGIEMTIDWYISNEKWMNKILSGKYRDYYKSQYGD